MAKDAKPAEFHGVTEDIESIEKKTAYNVSNSREMRTGVDMTDPDFWRGGFRVVAGMVDELAELAP